MHYQTRKQGYVAVGDRNTFVAVSITRPHVDDDFLEQVVQTLLSARGCFNRLGERLGYLFQHVVPGVLIL